MVGSLRAARLCCSRLWAFCSSIGIRRISLVGLFSVLSRVSDWIGPECIRNRSRFVHKNRKWVSGVSAEFSTEQAAIALASEHGFDVGQLIRP